MPQLNHMVRVLCPQTQAPSWANSTKGRDTYRCCTCGQVGHSLAREHERIKERGSIGG